ncbi:MAG: beta-galactosidase trimerization domain-containing protein, partial [Kiritimatiellaeota bacterium]|nr:beta-galactosidase trimerization domain-containing protein [Kiritimatiellota bacterium]
SNHSAVFRRVAELGGRLARLDGLVGASRKPEAAVVYDWESSWAMRNTNGFGGNANHILDTAARHHAAISRLGIPLAVVECRCDLTPYKILVLPMVFMFREGFAEKLRAYVENGGTLLLTGLSGYVDENNLCLLGGYPGGAEMRQFLGVWNEDVDCLAPEDVQTVRLSDAFGAGAGKTFQPVRRFAERLHAEGAEVMAVFEHDVLAGLPALTRRAVGKGRAWYLGTEGGDDLLDALYPRLLDEAGLQPTLPGLPPSVRVEVRHSADADYYFLINLSAEPRPVELPKPMVDVWNDQPASTRVTLPPNGGTLLMTER